MSAPLPWLLAAVLLVLCAVLVIVYARNAGNAGSLSETTSPLIPTSPRLLADAGCHPWRTDTGHRFVGTPEEAFDTGPETVCFPPGKTWWEIDCEAVGDVAWESCRACVEHRIPFHVLVRFSDIAGRPVYLEVSGEPMLHDGQFDGYAGLAVDVTRRVAAEHALSLTQALHEDVLESLREVVYRSDQRTCFTFLNRAWEGITGHRVVDSIGKPLADFLHPDDRLRMTTQLERLQAGEIEEARAQVRMPTRNGEIRWVDATARLVHNPTKTDQLTTLVGSFDDITDTRIAELSLRNINQELEARVRMRTAELEASNRELEAFSYSVSHDLRAPLRSIDGFTRILEEDLGDRLDPESRGNLERIRAAAGRMARLTDDLIELARFSRHTLRRENIDLSELAMQIVDELRAQEPGRRVEVEITSDLMITTDRTLMRTVLENLLGNAWKFTSGREVAHIAFRAEMQDGQRVFTVSDNGVGFDMAHAGSLFRAFYRMHDPATYPGTGIGLANVYRIIERLGGRIWAHAAPNQGARFHFTFDA